MSFDNYDFTDEVEYQVRNCVYESCETIKKTYTSDDLHKVLEIKFGSEVFDGKNMIDFLSKYGKIYYEDSNKELVKLDIDNAVGLVGLSLLAVILIPILVCICITVALICVCCRKRDNVVYINNPAPTLDDVFDSLELTYKEFGQRYYESPLRMVDLIIHIGEVTGDVYRVKPKEVWRVSEDGALRDMFGQLTRVFMMPEKEFFEHYNTSVEQQNTLHDACLKEYNEVLGMIPELPFGNLWMAQHTIGRIPNGSVVHMGIYNSLRSWSFFNLPEGVKGQCNVGGFGIDGGVSTMIGASLAQPNKLIFGIFGDLAFFYDMNVLGNRHVGNNVRLLLINNAKGAEFRLKAHLCSMFGEGADKFMAAAGHYGNKSAQLVKHYAEDLGYQYLSATSKDEFLQNLDAFVTPNIGDKPIVFEVFTSSEDESEALETLLQLKTESSTMLKTKMKQTVKNIVGNKGLGMLKKLKI